MSMLETQQHALVERPNSQRRHEKWAPLTRGNKGNEKGRKRKSGQASTRTSASGASGQLLKARSSYEKGNLIRPQYALPCLGCLRPPARRYRSLYVYTSQPFSIRPCPWQSRLVRAAERMAACVLFPFNRCKPYNLKTSTMKPDTLKTSHNLRGKAKC
eukprot:1146737-Pelagomonas_calceolata.AAC.5